MNTKRALLYLAAFILPPLLLVAWKAASALSEAIVHPRPAPLKAGAESVRPRSLAAGKLTAVILTSNAGTQLTDLLGPYEALSASGAFQVFTAAPLKQLSPTTGAVAILPDYTLDEAPQADLLVLPAVLDPSNSALISWIKARAPRAKLVLSVCEGARLAIEAGLLAGKSATTHFMAIRELKQRAPSIRWIEGARYISDGAIITSAGVTASIDATLQAIERLKGNTVAVETAARLGHEWRRESEGESDAGVSRSPAIPIDQLDFSTVLLNAGLRWSRRDVAVLLYPGVSEIGLAAYLETFPRAFGSRVTSISEERKPVYSRHGLALVAADSGDSPFRPDILIVPSGGGGSPNAVDPARAVWIEKRIREMNIPVKSFFYNLPGQSFDHALGLLSQLDGARITRLVARIIEYPWSAPAQKDPLPDGGLSWLDIALKLLAVGLLGVAAAWTVERRIGRSSDARPT